MKDREKKDKVQYIGTLSFLGYKLIKLKESNFQKNSRIKFVFSKIRLEIFDRFLYNKFEL